LETAVKKLYEAMFLVDSAQAPDWDAVVKTVKTILKRSDVEMVSIRNWAERKLAYEINHKSRGAYALCYFRAEGDKIRSIEKDVQLSEQIMRVLILSAETREKEALQEEDKAASDSQAHEGGDSPAPAKATPDRDGQAQDKTAEIQSSQEEGQIEETQEAITEEPSEDQQQIEKQAPEKTDALQDSDETDEPEKSAEIAQTSEADTSEPEQTEQSETEKDTTEKDVWD
jgi:ribosomal protein S6